MTDLLVLHSGRNNWRISELSLEKYSLDNIFLRTLPKNKHRSVKTIIMKVVLEYYFQRIKEAVLFAHRLVCDGNICDSREPEHLLLRFGYYVHLKNAGALMYIKDVTYAVFSSEMMGMGELFHPSCISSFH